MTDHLDELTDVAAVAEARRLAQVLWARQKQHSQWLGQEEPIHVFDENCGFVMGMLSMFRYARGEQVPSFLVRDYMDELLNLMFCGLASNVLALPSFNRMQDKPWALAWRRAEIRLIIEAAEPVEVSRLAHLLGLPANDLSHRLGLTDADNGMVSVAALQGLI